ncbi:MAG: hypothetical protein ISS63_07570 [Desulfobacteraceae bacterium]|nr:hypothetical protein [Desulfobacteraceae bacterium]
MNSLGIPQDRITKRLGVFQQTISYHLPKMPELANSVNNDLSRGFTVAQVAEKHGCPDGHFKIPHLRPDSGGYIGTAPSGIPRLPPIWT